MRGHPLIRGCFLITMTDLHHGIKLTCDKGTLDLGYRVTSEDRLYCNMS